MNDIEFIHAMQVLELKPDDIIVLKTKEYISLEAYINLKNIIKKTAQGHKCIILEAGIDIGVLRKKD